MFNSFFLFISNTSLAISLSKNILILPLQPRTAMQQSDSIPFAWISCLLIIFILVYFCLTHPTKKKQKNTDEQFYQQMLEQTPKSDHSPKEKILELKKLQEEGLITVEEFEKAKAKFINEM